MIKKYFKPIKNTNRLNFKSIKLKLNIGNVLGLSPNPKTFFAVSANIGNLRSVIFLNKLSLRSYYLIYNIYARMYNKQLNNYLPLFR